MKIEEEKIGLVNAYYMRWVAKKAILMETLDHNDERWITVICRKSAAELNQVYWLEVTGCVDKTRGDKIYEVGFHVSLTPDAFGWGDVPLYLMVKRGKDGKFVWKKFFMDHHTDDQGRCYITGNSTQAQNMGAQDSDVSKLYFGLYEAWSGKWKGGLKIHHAVIRELPST
ncbi:hypothetical protein DH2020_009053 [Rehmannia glutinosa]|uniref:Protein PHLOEM PROTEIN 2-LIKE A9-like n=1 Tax=Rehmannia glutinosa TaxID=99300 RepID=A0ABR0X5S3_REHGL